MLHSGPSLDKPVQLPTLLEVGLKHRPGHPALMSLEESWSWSELEQRARTGLPAIISRLVSSPATAWRR